MKKVFFNNKNIATLDYSYLQKLKEKVSKSSVKTIRFCLHKNVDDLLHEMVIVLLKGAYVRPHKHEKKTETFHLIEGSFFLVIFDRKGKIIKKILMSKKREKSNFLCRLDKNTWHMVIPISNLVIFHEVTNGPYTKENNSVFAWWAPEGKDKDKVGDFIRHVLNK